jgi:hypothetical protein
MARKSRLARQRQRSNLMLGSFAVLVVVAVAIGSAWWWGQKKSGLDAKTLCPTTGPIGHHVLLIDKTDPLNLAQKAAFDLLVKNLVTRDTPRGYLLSIFVLGEDFKAQTTPLVELCNPGDGKGHDELTENIKQLNRQYQNGFIKPIASQTTQLLSATSAQESPILEMLQMVSLNSFQSHQVNGPKTLIVLTDLLQNSKQLNMYKGIPNFADFYVTSYAQRTKIQFDGVDVKVHLLQNSPALQKQNLLDFWQQYFQKAGAQSVEFEPLPG